MLRAMAGRVTPADREIALVGTLESGSARFPWQSAAPGSVDDPDLMEAGRLAHVDSASAIARLQPAFDVYLSGYIGDVVAGSTWHCDEQPRDLLAQLPYYGGTLAIPYEQALDIGGVRIGQGHSHLARRQVIDQDASLDAAVSVLEDRRRRS